MPLHWLKKKFRAFELYTVDIVLGRRADAGATVYGAFLQALSWLFNGIVQTRLWLYRHRVLHDHPLGCLVVVVGNLTVGGKKVTAVVVQHPEDGIQDGHEVVFQTEPPKHQYRCFLASFAAGKTPVVPPDAAADAPCP